MKDREKYVVSTVRCIHTLLQSFTESVLYFSFDSDTYFTLQREGSFAGLKCRLNVIL
jgi:hypothetical protein